MKKVFCTVLTEHKLIAKLDYRPAIQTMLYSMKKNGNVEDIPMIIFNDGLCDDTKKRLLKLKQNIEFRTVNKTIYEATKDKHNARYYSFESFLLTEYDRVVFLDSDLFIVKDINGLFEIENNISMGKEDRRDCYNAGVIVLDKSMINYDVYKALLAHEAPEHIFGNDQKIYNSYFKNINKLEKKYNTLVTEVDNIENICILHYIHKPYILEGRNNLDKHICDLWLDMYFESEKLL